VTDAKLGRIGSGVKIPEPTANQGPVELGDGATVRDLIAAALTRSARVLVAADPGVRAGTDPEAVHDARVACRRIRSHLKMFHPTLDRDWADGIRREARWLASLLGGVRDAEVLHERLRSRLVELYDPAEVGAALLVSLDTRRSKARRRLLESLASDRYPALLWAVVEAAREPRGRGRRAGRPADRAPALLAEPWRALEVSVKDARRTEADDALHRVRIDTKQVRYGAEAIVPVAGGGARRFAADAKRLQEVLGEHQDAVTAIRWLTERADRADTPTISFVAGRLVQLELAARDRARAAWPSTWSSLRRRARPWS
jgi:CHAD domain-containing protein